MAVNKTTGVIGPEAAPGPAPHRDSTYAQVRIFRFSIPAQYKTIALRKILLTCKHLVPFSCTLICGSVGHGIQPVFKKYFSRRYNKESKSWNRSCPTASRFASENWKTIRRKNKVHFSFLDISTLMIYWNP